MKLIYPEFLWAFAVLLIPIIIHLFNFKRYKTHYFSSLKFVKHVDQQTRSTQKLKHLLVLASRLLAFIFLVLAFAQPYKSTAEDGNLKKESIIAFFIDNSFSMQARGVEGELLSEARESARSVIEKAPIGTSFIIGTHEMSGLEQRKLTRIEALEKLDNIDYSPLSHSLEEIVEWQEQTVKKAELDETQSLVQSVILSDFQRIYAKNSSQSKLDNFRFYPVQLTPEQKDNLFIDSVWFSTPIRRVGNRNELNIRVVNNSEDVLQNIEVSVNVGSFRKTFFVDIPANQKKSTSITYMDKSGGFKSGRVTVADDHVLFDDSYYFSYEVKENANILLLNGEDATENMAIALDLEDFYIVEKTDITAITLDNFKNKDMVIVNGANALSSGVVTYLSDFYTNGGSLALFPGKNPDKSGWNQLLSQTKMPRMGRLIQSGTKINTLNYDDPFISGAIDTKSGSLNLPSVTRCFQPIVDGNANYRTLITMKNGLPLLAYSRSLGNIYMFYSAIHPDWGAFSSDALFSTCVLRMGELSQRIQPISLTIGSQTAYPVVNPDAGEDALHLIQGELDFIPQTITRSGITFISLNQFDRFERLLAGNYSIEGSKLLGNLALNYGRKESKLDYFEEDEIVQILENKGAKDIQFRLMDGVSSPISEIGIDKPFGYWKICIVLTLIFVLAEMLLIRFLKS